MKFKKLFSILAIAFTINTLSPAFIKEAKAETAPPTIIGEYAVTIDAETGEIIYAKGVDAKAYPASITKLLTAVLLAENKTKTDTLEFTATALKQPDYSIFRSYGPIGLGTTINGDDVMKALLLFSGNDIAHVVSDSISGNTEAFAELMNKRLKEWGLTNSHFTNPNGLHDDNHYTTAYDLAVMAKKAYENEWVRETMALDKATITTSKNLPINLENRNKNVGLDGCIGGKTGWTTPAGRSLAAIYEREGRTIIGVVLKSAYDANDTAVFNDMKSIIDYSYAAEKTAIKKAGETVGTYDVNYKVFKFFGPEKTISVPMTLMEDIQIYDNEVNNAEGKGTIALDNVDAWELSSKAESLTYTYEQRGSSENYKLKAMITTSDIIKANATIYGAAVGALLIIIILIIMIIILIKRGSRRSKSSWSYTGSRRRRRR